MNDLSKRYSISHLGPPSTASLVREYDKGFEACKKMVLEILNRDLHNLDLSTDSCDKRYIEQIEKL